jgi:hypothetical protein
LIRKVKVKYEEGAWFLVPLLHHGFIAGVVARVSSTHKGILLGYFFSDIYVQHPSLDALCSLNPSSAREVIRFGDMGLRNGEWPILGKCANWSSTDWGMPNFVREEPLTKRRYEVFYDSVNPALRLGEKELTAGEGENLKRDSFWGHFAVQRYMAHILGFEVPPLDIEKLRGK